MNNIRYGFQQLLTNTTLDDARQTVLDALSTEGFGVLSEIDMSATLKKKLDVDFRPYHVLAACNPNLAWRGLQHEPHIGLLLPCNVVIQQQDDDVLVSIIDAPSVFALVDNEKAAPIGQEAGERLRRVIDKLAK